VDSDIDQDCENEQALSDLHFSVIDSLQSDESRPDSPMSRESSLEIAIKYAFHLISGKYVCSDFLAVCFKSLSLRWYRESRSFFPMLLSAGQKYSGIQQVASRGATENWRVSVAIEGIDLKRGYICGR